jgi:hypothetical protein
MAEKEQLSHINQEAMLEGAAAALRIDPIRLLAQGRESSTTSHITKTEDGKLTIATDIPHPVSPTPRASEQSIMTVEGKSTVGGGLSDHLHTDLTITMAQGRNEQVLKGQFDLTGSVLDAAYGRYDKSTRSLSLTDQSGRLVQGYEPAGYRIPEGLKDGNGQPVRIAEATSGNNCRREDETNPAKGVQCVSLLHDSKLGDFGYFQTATKDGALEYRTVLRTQQGGVLGIVQQRFYPDGRITTVARRPEHLK